MTEHTIPFKKPDFYLVENYAPCWDRGDHYACRVFLNDGDEIIIATNKIDGGNFTGDGRMSLLKKLLERYAIATPVIPV